MPDESVVFDQKSIRYVLGKNQDMDGLACDCVGLANERGGKIFVGLEDKADAPPPGQVGLAGMVNSMQKRLPQLTVNVQVTVTKQLHANGAEYLCVEVARNEGAVASTTDGRYFIRVADETKRLLPDQLARLMGDRSAFSWELQPGPVSAFDQNKQQAFLSGIRASDRVKDSVKAKSDQELQAHYNFVRDANPTNLGVLWLGTALGRSALSHAPVVQAIKYDERGQKIRKWSWDDYSLNPMEMIEAIWKDIPDWQESYELPDGLFRKTVPHYDEKVVRELLVNALVHRPYTTGGSIFINLYPDRLEVHNPGLLPIGVTPTNILHASQQRNPHLARVCHDLRLMEREGTGFNLLYRVLLSTGRRPPEVQEGDDRVVVIVHKRIIKPVIVDFMQKVENDYQPSAKEALVLGTLAQHESLTAKELAKALELSDAELVGSWLGKLREWGLITVSGNTKGTRYHVNVEVLRKTGFQGQTTLKRIEDYRVRELILADLRLHQKASRAEIHGRIGPEIRERQVRRNIDALMQSGDVVPEGKVRWRKYLLTETDRKTAVLKT
jgi:ATP-dependent DNA helicase RecG